MNCKWCNKQLTEPQVYSFLRGKSFGNCSARCSMLIFNYKTKQQYDKIHTSICVVCNKSFLRNTESAGIVCSIYCQGVLHSKRMIDKNPMRNIETRKKVSDTLKRIGHKPIKQGGNGRGNTIEQQLLYNELIKIHKSFVCEFIFKTKGLNKEKKYSNHYKIDIASEELMIAIEVDGASHKSLKVKECDKKKTNLLASQGWKVLRLSNLQIQKELENCVQVVMSMI